MTSGDAERRREAQEAGRQAEDWVSHLLGSDGWNLLAQNWSGSGAELDLVVERAGVLRFVEVKARQRGDDGAEAVTRSKQQRLIRAARCWLDERGEPAKECGFLVAVVTLGARPWQVEWLDDAFDA